MDRDKIISLMREAGIVGAGGAGFPTYVKAGSKAEVVIANGAECEPLTHVDKELIMAHAPLIVAGMQAIMDSTGAARGRRRPSRSPPASAPVASRPGRCPGPR